MKDKTSIQNASLVPIERIQKCIYVIRGRKVILDSDLSGLYGVQTKVLLQAIKRNIERFPADFMFQLSASEFKILRSQIVTSSWGGRRYAPYAFTEQGVAMLSSVLRSRRAIEINIAIIRVFVRLRKILADNAALRKKLEEHDEKIKYIFNVLGQMLQEEENPKKRIGYLTEMEGHKRSH
jgi:phage regulator Rha-like protein